MPMPDDALRSIERTLGELTAGVKGLHDKIDDRDTRSIERYERLGREMAELRKDHVVISRQVNDSSNQCEVVSKSHEVLMREVAGLSKSMRTLTSLRNRAAGVFLVLGLLGSILLTLVSPVIDFLFHNIVWNFNHKG